jgi:hypothetical protein
MSNFKPVAGEHATRVHQALLEMKKVENWLC